MCGMVTKFVVDPTKLEIYLCTSFNHFNFHCVVCLQTQFLASVAWVVVPIDTCKTTILVEDFFFFFNGLSTIWSLRCDLSDLLLLYVHVHSFSSSFNSSSSIWSSWMSWSKVRAFFTPFLHLWSREIGFGSCAKSQSSTLSFSFFFSEGGSYCFAFH